MYFVPMFQSVSKLINVAVVFLTSRVSNCSAHVQGFQRFIPELRRKDLGSGGGGGGGERRKEGKQSVERA